MTTYQSNFDRYISMLVQSGQGVPATGAGGIMIRVTGGTPGDMSKAAIPSKEIRADAQPVRGRHGQQSTVGGPYGMEMSLQSMDQIMQAVMRATWDTEITKTQADFTSLTTGAHTIIMTSGNPITMGFRINDVIDVLNFTDAGNNLTNLRITGLSATTITVAETLIVEATPDTTCSVVRRGRKIINPVAASLVNRFFTIEEYLSDITISRLFNDCLWKSMKFSMAPDGMVTFEPSWMGTGAFLPSSGVAVLTSPTLFSSTPMAALDATLRLGGADVADVTALDITVDNGAVAPKTVAAKTAPTVAPGLNQVSLNITLLTKDVSYMSGHLNETSYSLSLKCVSNMAAPQDFISINVPFFTLGGAKISPPSTAGGVSTQTIAVPAALIGHDTTGTGFDDTTISIQVSNNS